jgi:lactoylglutathione lyase
MNRSFCVLVLLAVSLTLKAQKNDGDVRIRLNHLAVYVHDLKSSTDFYDSILNLKKIEEPFKDGLHTWYSMGEVGQLHLIQGAEKNVARNKNDHLCFSVPSIDAFLDRLKRFNVAYSNWPGEPNQVTTRVDGVKQIYFQDPDGHWIEINNDFGKKKK